MKINKDWAERTIGNVGGAVVGVCASKLAVDIVLELAPEPVKVSTKIAYTVGTAVVGAIAASGASEYTKDYIDGVIDRVHIVQEQLESDKNRKQLKAGDED